MRGASALQPQYISSFGSVGQIAYTTTRISDCCISDTGMNLGLLDFSVLSHSAALPQKSDGLLGLQFLRSLILDSDYVIEIGKYNLSCGRAYDYILISTIYLLLQILRDKFFEEAPDEAFCLLYKELK